MKTKWTSLKEFFEDLNQNCVYVILRNWDSLKDESPYMSGHEDIDLLCSSLHGFLEFSKAKPIHYLSSRNNYQILIGNKYVRFDIRYVGDGYYDEKWENELLETRRMEGTFYVLSDQQLCYSLAYHALVQKPKLSNEYKVRIAKLMRAESSTEETIINNLKQYCTQKGYMATIPHDPGVYFNQKSAKTIGIEKDYYTILCRIMFRIKMKLRFKV